MHDKGSDLDFPTMRVDGFKSPRVIIYPDLEAKAYPTVSQWRLWGPFFLIPVIMPVQQIQMFAVWCPIHDDRRRDGHATAELSFKINALKCEVCFGNLRAHPLPRVEPRIGERYDEDWDEDHPR